jgi:hypothetical protein
LTRTKWQSEVMRRIAYLIKVLNGILFEPI